MRIRITAPCTTPKLTLEKGDVLEVKTITPSLQKLLDGRRIDGTPVAEVVRGHQRETATTRQPVTEKATA